jgi:hypothetical protein
VNDAKDGGCRADAQSESEDGDQGEAAIFAEIAEGVAKIAEEIVEMCFPAGVADLFSNAFEATEFLLGVSPRLFRT